MTKPTGNPPGRPRKTTKAAQNLTKTDGWDNVLTGLASRADPTTATRYSRDYLLTKPELESIFSGDGLGRRIVEMPAEESTRQWLKIDGDNGGDILDAMEVNRVQQHLTDAYVWARLYGGAIIVRLLDDGQDLEQPLRRETLSRVLGYRVYDRHSVTWTTQDLETDPASPQFGQPVLYTVQPSGGMPYRVHYTRVSKIDGKRLPNDERLRNNGWGASAMQGAMTSLRRVGEINGYSANIVRDFVQAVLSVKGLTDMIASGQDDLVKKRIQLLDLSRSVIQMMVMDAEGEQYTKTASSVAGLADLWDRFREAVCADTGIPMTKLFGRAPAGMSATGESDNRNYYDVLASEQKSCLSPVMEDIIRDYYTASEGPTRGNEPERWSLKWNPLWQATDSEAATTRKTVADADAIYLDRGVVTADEIAASRFGGGEYSMETAVEVGDA